MTKIWMHSSLVTGFYAAKDIESWEKGSRQGEPNKYPTLLPRESL